MKPEMVRRREAVDKTLAKYRNKPLDWKRYDCLRMVRSHLVALGHRGLPQIPRYSTPAQAVRALKARGFDTLDALMDTILPRIAPADMWLGDIVMVRGEGGIGSLMIWQGRKAAGWVEGYETQMNFTPSEFEAAWRA